MKLGILILSLFVMNAQAQHRGLWFMSKDKPSRDFPAITEAELEKNRQELRAQIDRAKRIAAEKLNQFKNLLSEKTPTLQRKFKELVDADTELGVLQWQLRQAKVDRDLAYALRVSTITVNTVTALTASYLFSSARHFVPDGGTVDIIIKSTGENLPVLSGSQYSPITAAAHYYYYVSSEEIKKLEREIEQTKASLQQQQAEILLKGASN